MENIESLLMFSYKYKLKHYTNFLFNVDEEFIHFEVKNQVKLNFLASTISQFGSLFVDQRRYCRI